MGYNQYMNRNVDGTALTNEQLFGMVRHLGMEEKIPGVMGLHNPGLIRSELLSLTASFRFEEFMSRRLDLSTSEAFVPAESAQERRARDRSAALNFAREVQKVA